MLGKELMVAPVFNDEGKRWIYFPEGKWFSWWDESVYEGPLNVFYKAEMDELPLFVKAGSIVPLGPIMDYVGQENHDPLTIEVYPFKESEFLIFEEDSVTRLKCVESEKKIDFSADGKNQNFVVRFHGVESSKKVYLNNTQIVPSVDKGNFEKKVFGYWYDNNSRILHVRFKGQKLVLSIIFP